MSEVAWFVDTPVARVDWPEETAPEGYLRFVDPEGQRAVIPVTRDQAHANGERHVWHIDISDGIATLSPSLHFVGHWHSPNPVQFRLTEGPVW